MSSKKSKKKVTHEIGTDTWYFSGYGDADLHEKRERCSCGEWLFAEGSKLKHMVEVLWAERNGK